MWSLIGKYRVRGDVIDVFPASEDERAIRIELFDDEVESLYIFDPLTGKKIKDLRQVRIFRKDLITSLVRIICRGR